MPDSLFFPLEALRPTRGEVLALQGLGRQVVRPRVAALFEDALALWAEEAAPASLLAEIPVSALPGLRAAGGGALPPPRGGENRSTPEALWGRSRDLGGEAVGKEAGAAPGPSPFAMEENVEGVSSEENDDVLDQVFSHAARAALFAFTLGEGISARIDALFAAGDFARAAMLDACASVSADRAGVFAEQSFPQSGGGCPGAGEAGVGAGFRTFLYSPGYCGWPLAAQHELFRRLRPERIGLRLTPQGLMHPLKSVSGVLVTALEGAHRFARSFPACSTCRTPACRHGVAR